MLNSNNIPCKYALYGEKYSFPHFEIYLDM